MVPPAGDLPPAVVLLFSAVRSRVGGCLLLKDAGPGFTLPADIGDSDPAITRLDLSGCGLKGTVKYIHCRVLVSYSLGLSMTC